MMNGRRLQKRCFNVLRLPQIKIAVSVLLTVFLVWFVFRGVSFGVVVENFKSIPVQAIVVAFFAYALMNLFRAFRFRLLFVQVGLSELYGVALIHNLMNNVLPFRVGEFSFMYLMRKHAGYDKTVTALVALRVLDFLVIVCIFLFATLFLSDLNAEFRRYGIFAAVIGVFLSLGIMAARSFPRHYLPPFFRQFHDALANYTLRMAALTAGWTFLIWLTSLFVFFILCNDMELGVGWIGLCVPITLVRLSNVLPVSGVAGFGTTEGAWVLGMLAVGANLEAAAASGLVVHVIRLCFTLILGLLGQGLLRLSGRKS